MKNKNTQSGITLIALVVTIVVLLILAGITVGFVLSDGGIFQSAQDAKVDQTAGEIKDIVSQIYPVMFTNYYADATKTTLTGEGLTKFFPTTWEVTETKTLTTTKGTDESVKVNGKFTVKPDGYDEAFTVILKDSVASVYKPGETIPPAADLT